MTTDMAGVDDDALLAVLRLCTAATVSAGNAAHPPLTATQVRVLNLLSVADGMTLTEVADALGATAPSASRLCGRLARDGLVARAAGAGHHLDLRLTPGGRRAVRTLNARRVRTLRRLVEAMPAGRQKQAAAGLRVLADAATADASPTSARAKRMSPTSARAKRVSPMSARAKGMSPMSARAKRVSW